MIKSIQLMNFKSFESEEIPLAPLTILMGENGVGKSSIIQSLLLLRQSADTGVLQQGGLSLNGNLCSVGVGRDLLRQGSDDEAIGIALTDSENFTHVFTFGYDPDADRLPLEGLGELPNSLTLEGFGYLTAERIGPRLTSPRSIAQASERHLGIHGEGSLAVLERFRAEILAPEDPRRKGRSGSLEELFQAYLAEICSNARIDLHPYGSVDTIGSTFSFAAPGDECWIWTELWFTDYCWLLNSKAKLYFDRRKSGGSSPYEESEGNVRAVDLNRDGGGAGDRRNAQPRDISLAAKQCQNRFDSE